MQSMLKHLSRRPTAFPTKLLLYVLEQLLLGLSACHRLADSSASPLAVVHRDVTPENILLGYDGRVMLTDFGIATSNLNHEGTQHGAPKGKTRYLSPEQALKQPLDGRSDLFSLGAVLYEAFGRALFDGVNQFVILEKVRAGDGLPGERISRIDLPEPARALLEKLLSFQRHDRPTDADAASALLRGADLAPQQHNMAQFVRTQFAKNLQAYDESNDRHLRLDLLDGEIVEHAPPRLDLTGSFAKGDSMQLGSDASLAPTVLASQSSAVRSPPQSDAEATIMSGQFAEAEGTPTPGDTMDVSHPYTLATDADQHSSLPDRKRMYLFDLGLLAALSLIGALAATFTLSLFSGSKTGGLLITSQPGEEINLTLNGQTLPSRSAIAIGNLEAGEHKVTAQRGQAATETVVVKLSPMDFKAVNFDLRSDDDQRANLTVQVWPNDATIEVDGKTITRGEKLGLTVGSRSVFKITRKGYIPQTREVLVRNTEDRPLFFELEPMLGTIFISSEPNATVYINGRKRGRTPVQLKEMDTNEDWHIRLVAAQHQVYEGKHHFGGNRILQVDKVLAPE